MNTFKTGYPFPTTSSTPFHKTTKQVDPEKAWKAAEEFEATFASHLIQQLFAGNDTGLFGGGQTEVLFRSFWAESLSKSLTGTFGIADSVYPLLLKQQEISHDK